MFRSDLAMHLVVYTVIGLMRSFDNDMIQQGHQVATRTMENKTPISFWRKTWSVLYWKIHLPLLLNCCTVQRCQAHSCDFSYSGPQCGQNEGSPGFSPASARLYPWNGKSSIAQLQCNLLETGAGTQVEVIRRCGIQAAFNENCGSANLLEIFPTRFC